MGGLRGGLTDPTCPHLNSIDDCRK
jgi:hypothetical protein